MKPALEIVEDTPEYQAVVAIAEDLAVAGRSLGDEGVDLRIVAEAALSAAVYLFARECGKEAAAAWLHRTAEQMASTWPRERTVN